MASVIIFKCKGILRPKKQNHSSCTLPPLHNGIYTIILLKQIQSLRMRNKTARHTFKHSVHKQLLSIDPELQGPLLSARDSKTSNSQSRRLCQGKQLHSSVIPSMINLYLAVGTPVRDPKHCEGEAGRTGPRKSCQRVLHVYCTVTDLILNATP